MIEEIIKDELVEINFQPIVSIRSKKIYAFEALTRCQYNEENIPPDILFSLAKEKNLSMKLDNMTRNKAIKKFYKYYLEDKDLILFLNIESSLINNFDLTKNYNSFLDVIRKLDIPFENFVLEVKEDEIINTNALKEFCKMYKELGFSIALDDFGTGSSTFDRINIIRPDIIKIDKSLFPDIKNNMISKEIVKAIAKMSHNLGIRVLAEGVEEEDAICLCMKSTINLFQGYYFSKAKYELSKKEFLEIIDKTIRVGKQFKIKTLDDINKKRDVIREYELIANNMIKKFDTLSSTTKVLEKEFKSLNNIEAIYLIDCKSSKQIKNTVINSQNGVFKASNDGEEHYLKEYYYITLESKQGSFLSQKYISYASGNICKTFAKKFNFKKHGSCILCLDIIVEGV